MVSWSEPLSLNMNFQIISEQHDFDFAASMQLLFEVLTSTQERSQSDSEDSLKSFMVNRRRRPGAWIGLKSPDRGKIMDFLRSGVL